MAILLEWAAPTPVGVRTLANGSIRSLLLSAQTSHPGPSRCPANGDRCRTQGATPPASCDARANTNAGLGQVFTKDVLVANLEDHRADGGHVRLADRRAGRALARTRVPGQPRGRRRGSACRGQRFSRTASIAIPTRPPKESSRAVRPDDSLATVAEVASAVWSRPPGDPQFVRPAEQAAACR